MVSFVSIFHKTNPCFTSVNRGKLWRESSLSGWGGGEGGGGESILGMTGHHRALSDPLLARQPHNHAECDP
jgi:hypothetical protein